MDRFWKWCDISSWEFLILFLALWCPSINYLWFVNAASVRDFFILKNFFYLSKIGLWLPRYSFRSFAKEPRLQMPKNYFAKKIIFYLGRKKNKAVPKLYFQHPQQLLSIFTDLEDKISLLTVKKSLLSHNFSILCF